VRRRPVARALLLVAPLLVAAGRFDRPPDPELRKQWALENRGEPIWPGGARRGSYDADVDAMEAFAAGWTGRGTTIALIGQGFAWREGPLAKRMWINEGEIPANGVDDDGNGWIDDRVGYDFGEFDPDPSADGAHDRIVAEIALAPHDGRGIAGIAPGARLMLIKIADDSGRILAGPLVLALRYAVANGARVVMMPWTRKGGRCSDPPLAAQDWALETAAASVLVIGGAPGGWPACHPGVVSVQATDAEDWPRDPPDGDTEISAPGAYRGRTVYVSYAIGVVAGVAALLLEQDPLRSPGDLRARLRETADRVHPELAPYLGGHSPFFGAGRLNAARALGTDFDGDGIGDADDVDADGDRLPDFRDRCPLDPDPGCGEAIRPAGP
jgi:subtilisin family serine protease